MTELSGQKVLIVERFDRAWMGGGLWMARRLQEDFCQALGHAWAQSTRKMVARGWKPV